MNTRSAAQCTPLLSAVPRGRACIYVLSLVLGCLFGSAHAGEKVADPELARGERVAREVCSACHRTGADQQFPPLLQHPAPSFIDIANRPATSIQSLQYFIMNTHWDADPLPMRMPDPMLMKDQAHAVARYILSLRKP